ncbi:MAG TPA: ferritin family protein, partial [Candidatus Deferrimicrobium sp.]
MKKGPSRAKESSVMKGLKQALRNEIDGAEFYRMAAGSARRDAVRQMFRFLMEEEERHREAIVNQMQRLAEGKGMIFER